jgi:hypothetical protein
MAGSHLRSPPLFDGSIDCSQVTMILRAVIILKHLLLKKALSAIDGSAAAGECAHPGAISPVPAWRALNTFDGRLLPSLSASLRWVRAAAAESARRMACA